jgi:hypothetical protein
MTLLLGGWLLWRIRTAAVITFIYYSCKLKSSRLGASICSSGASISEEALGCGLDEKYSLPAGFLEGLGTQGTQGAFGSKPGGGVASLIMLGRCTRGFSFWYRSLPATCHYLGFPYYICM